MPRGEFDRSARKAATRARLLEAAARVYAARGFAGATLDDVAEEAGLTKGAVYGHFGSKDNLLVALMEEYLAAEIAEQVALFDRDETTWKRPLGRQRPVDAASSTRRRTPFRLLVEFWVAAARDERLRERFAGGPARRCARRSPASPPRAPPTPACRRRRERRAPLRQRHARAEHRPRRWSASPTATSSRPRCSARRCRCSSAAIERDPELREAMAAPGTRPGA